MYVVSYMYGLPTLPTLGNYARLCGYKTGRGRLRGMLLIGRVELCKELELNRDKAAKLYF